jgi:low temperature requirement protein LtrA
MILRFYSLEYIKGIGYITVKLERLFMSLNNPDSRRGLRSVIQAVSTLAFIALLWWITGRLTQEHSLLTVARGALLILGLGELLYGAENVTRAVNFKVGPIEGGIGDDATK